LTLKISVVTAVFNRADTIADALDSVQGQNWPAVEHVVIDGGSTDGTLALLQARRADLGVLVSEPDGGIYDALNKGISRASGDVVGFLHADDLFESPDSLAQVAAAFEDPAVGAVYGDLVYVRKADVSRVVRYWRAGERVQGDLERGWMPPHPTFYVRRAVYAQMGLFDTRFRISADYECILRLLGHGGVKARYVPQVLVRMRLGGASNRSLGNMVLKSQEDLAAMRLNGLGGLAGLVALFRKNVIKLPQFVIRAPEARRRARSGKAAVFIE
jgi:glycosyltransferase